jgi:integrase
MPNVTFYLQGTGVEKYIYLSYYAYDGRVKTSIGLTVNKELWSKGKLPKNINQKLDRLRYVINDFAAKTDLASGKVYKADVESLIAEVVNRKQSSKNAIVSTCFQEYIDGVKAGEILNKGNKYSGATVHALESVLSYIKDKKHGSLKMDSIKVSDFDTLKTQMLADKLSQNTISLYITQFTYFIKRTYKLGWHKNTVYLTDGLGVAMEDIDTHVYLTVEEIKKIQNYKTEDERLALVRDAFVFGCNTGLRFSNLGKLTKNAVANGKLHITTKKGKNAVIIPLSRVALELFNRHGGHFPDIKSNSNFNTDIRTICMDLEINEKVLYSNTQGGVKLSEYYKKYELVGSHTMRRSFATNAYKAGVPTLAIMKITGHKTEHNFMKYIRISNEENADLISSHPFFDGK